MTAHRPGTADAPAPDQDAISHFVDNVFGYLEGFVPVRALSETGTPQGKPHSVFPTADNLAEALIGLAPDAAGDGRGLYVVPGTVAVPGSARAQDIVQTAVVLIDLDAGDIGAARTHLEGHLGAASLIVASGGRTDAGQEKLHLYWRLTEAASGGDLERVRALREVIASKVGGDTSFKSLHQPIRVPGTIHGKKGVRTEVRIIGKTDREYDLNDFEEAAAEMPFLDGNLPAPTTDPRIAVIPTAADLATTKIRAGVLDGTSRFDALSSVIGHWLRNSRLGRCSLEEAWTAVRDHNAAMIVPPWDEHRLRREFDALHARDLAEYGLVPNAVEQTPRSATENESTPLSDDALAAEFVRRAEDGYRFVAAWGKWMAWNEGRWVNDEVGRSRELSRQVCRDAARTAEKPPDARRVASDKTIAAVVRIASTDPLLATRTVDWDTHSFLLNTPAGVLDLETGEITPHDRRLLITQMTGASPGNVCPRWQGFLKQVSGEDAELQSYLARLAGYCLTGSTSEQVFAFFHGPGANGKSVFINTIASVLGDYTATATNETFMASRSDRHLSELAGLRAARLVIVPETENGRAWAEARIKAVTGGEKIRANFMRQDHFEFTPQFKLVVAGNHRPSLTGVGEAMRRRLHLVPFDVTIPAGKRDPLLTAKLLEERDGILGWMLKGCAEWQRIGLAPPASVVDAGARYFDDEDVVGQWIEECCVIGTEHSATAVQLFESWSDWAARAGQDPGSQKSLGQTLRARGCTSKKVGGQRGWRGIALRTGGAKRGKRP